MSAYTTQAGLEKRIDPIKLAMLADDSTVSLQTQAQAQAALLSTSTAGVLTQAIADASLMIDHHLLGRVDMTDATNQAAVEPHAATLALYFLYRRRGHEGENNPMLPGYQYSIGWLKDMAAGKLHIDDSPQVPARLVKRTNTSDTQKFTDTELEHF